jgi:hypothetical protein
MIKDKELPPKKEPFVFLGSSQHSLRKSRIKNTKDALRKKTNGKDTKYPA